MKKTMLVIALLFSILFCACSEKTGQKQDLLIPYSNINESDNTAVSLDDYGLRILSFPVVEGFRFQSIRWVNDESLLVIENDKTSQHQKGLTTRVYCTTFTGNDPLLVYEGPYLGNDALVQCKQLQNGDLLLSGTDKALRIESHTFTIIETIQYQEGSYEADISYDGKKIAYVNKRGLFVDTIPSSKPVLLFERKNSEKEKKAPTEPKWSRDGQALCYAVNGNEPFKYVFVTPDGNQIFEYTIRAHGLGWWFGDSRSFAAVSLGENLGMKPLLCVIDTNNKAGYETEKNGALLIECQPYKEQVLYKQLETQKISELGYFPQRLILFNITNKAERVITPDFRSIVSCAFSPSGKVAFIGNYNNPKNEFKIYVIKKSFIGTVDDP